MQLTSVLISFFLLALPRMSSSAIKSKLVSSFNLEVKYTFVKLNMFYRLTSTALLTTYFLFYKVQRSSLQRLELKYKNYKTYRPILKLTKLPFLLFPDVYEARMRDKPSVRVTSPGSPDIHSSRPSRIRHTLATNANVGGRMQVS